MGMSYKFYAAERIGPLPGNYTVPWRGSAYMQVLPATLLSCPGKTNIVGLRVSTALLFWSGCSTGVYG